MSRRPAATLLHELVRDNLEPWLATAAECDEHGRGVPTHVEGAFREYPKCGEPMRIIAFVLDCAPIEWILTHLGVIGGRTALPVVKD